MEDYRYPGQFKADGIIYNDYISAEALLKIRDELKLDHSDFVLVTYPKSGTLWMSEIYKELTAATKHQGNFREITGTPYLEFHNMVDEDKPTGYHVITSLPAPRQMRTHLPVLYFKRLLEDKEHCPKFIVVYRNPKDTLVSYYHFHRMVRRHALADLSWDDFFEMYKRNTIYYGEVVDHHIGWWQYRDHSNVLMISYEDLLDAASATVRRVSDFLGLTVSDEDISHVVQETSFKQMQSRGLTYYSPTAVTQFDEKISPFIRKGKKGDWRSMFSSEQAAYIDDLIARKATPRGLSYSD